MSTTPSAHEIGDRRGLLFRIGTIAALVVSSCASGSGARRDGRQEADGGEGDVTPGEDLMQEHGVIERILLVYGEAARRIERDEGIDPSIVGSAAELALRFGSDYHERLEEQSVFPRLEAAGIEVALTATLRRQHARARELASSVAGWGRVPRGDRTGIARALRDLERMYRPHAAREDTIVFPAFRRVVGRAEYHELGEEFEEREETLVGPGGFDQAVREVARLEGALGIFELDRFTAP